MSEAAGLPGGGDSRLMATLDHPVAVANGSSRKHVKAEALGLGKIAATPSARPSALRGVIHSVRHLVEVSDG